MLKKFDKFTFAHSPWTNFDHLDDAEHTFGENPAELTETSQLRHEIHSVLGGREIIVKQLYTSANDEYTEARNFSLRFPEADREFSARLYGRFRRGDPIAFATQETLGTGVGALRREELRSVSTNDYWYTGWGPFDGETIKLFDSAGNTIFERLSTNDTNPYSLTIQAEKGRIYNPTNAKIPWGIIEAEYNPIAYGQILSIEPSPQPGFNPALFTPTVSIKELRTWPDAATRTYRFYLRASGYGGAQGPSPIPQAVWTDGGHYAAAKTTVRDLSPTKGASATYIEATETINPNHDFHYDFAGCWASASLAAQVIPVGTVATFGVGVHQQPPGPSPGDLYPAAYIYIWRPAVGKIATLLDWDGRASAGKVGTTTESGSHTNPNWSVIRGEELARGIDILENDVLVVEMWGYQAPESDDDKWYRLYYDGTDADKGDDQYNSSPATFVQFSNPIFLKD